MPLTSGTRLGCYEILSPLGAGGMGEVYRAVDRKLDRHVAIKVMAEKFAGDSQATARFEREAKAVAAISHPNILAIHDFGCDQGLVYAVSELLEGQTLRQHMSSREVGWREAVNIAIAAAEGLSAAHAKGIVHRDLKPENIFLTSDGQVKILDFGLAIWTRQEVFEGDTLAETKTVTSTVAGTPGYMSPEQLRGEPAAPTSDLFSFGCVLYEMIAGRTPFSHATSGEIIAAILRDDPKPFEPGKHPPELERLIARCLEKQPAARWQSARDLGFALRGLPASSEGAQPRVEVTRAGRGHLSRWVLCGLAGLFLITAALLFIRNKGTRPSNIRSLAVLPLRNLSGDPEQEYFADGMTESLISQLAQIRALKVISRTSVMRYKGSTKSLPEIAKDLNVEAVVDGSVQRAGGRVRIMAQLIQAPDDVHLWAKDYESELTDVLRLEGEVARAIASEVRVQLSAGENSRLSNARTVNPKAHEAYLLGRHYLWKLHEADLKEAIAQFELAIQMDPSYAEAYVGLATALAERGVWGAGGFRSGEAKAKSAVQKAIELNPNLSDAHSTLAFMEYHYNWNWSSAEQGFRRALELDPNSRQAHTYYAVMLMALGRFPESLSQIDMARELDPVSSYVESTYGRILYRARRYGDALIHLQRASQLDPNDYSTYPRLADVYQQMGKYTEAIAAAGKASRVGDGMVLHSLRLAQIYAHMGKKPEALQCFEQAKSNPDWGRNVLDIALTYAELGDRDQAFAWLEKGIEQRDLIIFVKTEPKCDSLRGDPRFDRIVDRIGLR